MKVIGLEQMDGGKVVKVTIKGPGATTYSNLFFLYVPADGDIPQFGQEFALIKMPALEPVSA